MPLITPSKIERIIKKTVLSEIISASRAANMPKSFIDNIVLTKISDTQWEITNNWVGDDDDGTEPLAKFFEYGTPDHYIEPKKKGGILASPSGGKYSGSSKAIYSKNSQAPKKGSMIFSTGHWVKGLPDLEPMNRGFEYGLNRMKEELSRHGG